MVRFKSLYLPLLLLYVADSDQLVIDITVLVGKEVIAMEEEGDETTSLVNTEKMDSSEGIIS